MSGRLGLLAVIRPTQRPNWSAGYAQIGGRQASASHAPRHEARVDDLNRKHDVPEVD